MKVACGVYRHYKGSLYTVLMQATHSETQEDMVVYLSQETQKVWVRPAKMFSELIELNGRRIRRFALYPSEASRAQVEAGLAELKPVNNA